ncbi:MAG: carbohydrate kinase family protein, partial [Nitrososphaerota archaeon]|nr:carbohydrate kinase family protein [Nitrososphaerota archaeon]
DAEHLPILRNPFAGLSAEVRVKPLQAGLTVAIEGRVNVMLGDVGGAGRLGPELLASAEWDALESAKVVCSLNWAANSKGTELLLALRERLGRTKTIFFGPADFRDRLREFRRLLSLQQRMKLFDWLALNENEARASARLLGIRARGPASICRQLSLKLGSRVDIHTRSAAYTAEGGRIAQRVAKPAGAIRLTGAGDVWDAASIYANLSGMSDGERLEFANAAARLYITYPEPRPPSRDEILAELE